MVTSLLKIQLGLQKSAKVSVSNLSSIMRVSLQEVY